MNHATRISELRKAGKLQEALTVAQEAHAADREDVYVQRAYGWVIHDLVRQCVEGFAQGSLKQPQFASDLTSLLRQYARLRLIERPGLLHSLLLSRVLKGARGWPSFIGFLKWWDPAMLREEDRKPYVKSDGKSLPSIQTRMCYAIARGLLVAGREEDPELTQWGWALFSEAYKENPRDTWLAYYEGRRLLTRGEFIAARGCFMTVVKRQRSSAWAWLALGRTFEADAPAKAITCGQHAVRLVEQGKEALRARLWLGRMLAVEQRFDEATFQVLVALRLTKQLGDKVPAELARLTSTPWFKEHEGSCNVSQDPDMTQEAMGILFASEAEDIEIRVGVIDHQNAEKALTWVLFGLEDGKALLHRRFRQLADLPPGTLVDVSLCGKSREPVHAKVSNDRTVPGFCEEFDGRLERRPGAAFGFVACEDGVRVFVPPPVLARLAMDPETQVHCVAILDRDRKRGVLNWRAVAVRLVRTRP